MENSKAGAHTQEIIQGHNSFETAYKIENYPFGFRLKTTQYIWVESVPKKGDRIIRQTVDPRTGKLCAPKASTFAPIMWLYVDDVGHVQSNGVGIYTDRSNIVEAVELLGGVSILNENQQRQYNQLMGINDVAKGDKPFSVKWEKDKEGKCDELRITFDRPDGVQVREIFEALKSVNQTRLNEVFTIRNYGSFGNHEGLVRICVRGGVQLTTVKKASYEQYLNTI